MEGKSEFWRRKNGLIMGKVSTRGKKWRERCLEKTDNGKSGIRDELGERERAVFQ